jgi:hypothetical protein
MISPKLKGLIKTLITTDKLLDWEQNPDNLGEYDLKLGLYNINIEKDNDSIFFSVNRIKPKVPIGEIIVADKETARLDYQSLNDLYTSIKDREMKLEAIIDEMMKELNNV